MSATSEMKAGIVGLCGFKRSGKDTLAQEMALRDGFIRIAMADALRAEVWALHGVPPVPDAMKDMPFPDRADGASYRDILRMHGQARRKEDPDYWVKKVAEAIHSIDAMAAAGGIELPRELPRYVIPDVRMENEIDWIRAHGGVLIWIRRPGRGSDGHATERDLSCVADFVIENDASPAALHAHTMTALSNQNHRAASGSTRIWRYSRISKAWTLQRACAANEAERWVDLFRRKFAVEDVFAISKEKPARRPVS